MNLSNVDENRVFNIQIRFVNERRTIINPVSFHLVQLEIFIRIT